MSGGPKNNHYVDIGGGVLVPAVVALNADGEDMAAIGAPDDAAWSGTGNGTVIAILKACYAKLAEIATNTAT